MNENAHSGHTAMPESMPDLIPTIAPQAFNLPEPIRDLGRLAMNLLWTWRSETQDLFRRLDPGLWAEGKSPVQVLLASGRAREMAADGAFVADVRRAAAELDRYLAGAGEAWYARQGRKMEGPVAYFCAEYGLSERFNQYSGGLGILAGDHCKEASDMGLPFVAVGLFYRRGFFRQLIDWEGRQEHFYPELRPETSPVTRVLRPGTDEPLTILLEIPGRRVAAAVWLASVGRVPLILLDTDVDENSTSDRPITSQLYTNGRDMRLHQEMVLGVGGVRALRALGIQPSAWHLNEGHSAFLLLERLREHVAEGKSLEAAREAVRSDSILTIHTPVPAGNERFGSGHALSLIAPVLEGSGVDPAAILDLGLGEDADPEAFDMTAFALRHARAANGVSLLHGQTADRTWRDIAGYEVVGVTNGVHMPTWIGPAMRALFAEHGATLTGGTEVAVTPRDESRPAWDGILQADDRAIWEAHLSQKRALVEYARERLFRQHARHGEGPGELRELMEALDPEAFFIGFARRFATYKRASLLFSDEDRLERLLNAEGRPVQVLFAGKAHPADRSGQELIQAVYRQTRSPRFRGKVFLLEDYDMEVGRCLVQGVDIWLNNPRRPLEASGTSGMKAAANGVPNVSILDGWWDEAFEDGDRRNGWAIGGRETLEDETEQDRRDADELYRTLEEEVIPAFFDRDANGTPARWLPVMKHSIASSLYAFSTRRMLEDYLDRMLTPVR